MKEPILQMKKLRHGEPMQEYLEPHTTHSAVGLQADGCARGLGKEGDSGSGKE